MPSPSSGFVPAPSSPRRDIERTSGVLVGMVQRLQERQVALLNLADHLRASVDQLLGSAPDDGKVPPPLYAAAPYDEDGRMVAPLVAHLETLEVHLQMVCQRFEADVQRLSNAVR